MATRRDMPTELKQQAVVTGEGFFQKRVFVEDRSLGQVTDILLRESPEAPIGIAGLGGAVWVTRDGKVTSSVAIQASATHIDFVDVDGDGTFEFLNRGGSG